MLDAAVCGDVFASPSQIQVYQAIRSASNKGTPLLSKLQRRHHELQNAAHLASEDGIKWIM